MKQIEVVAKVPADKEKGTPEIVAAATVNYAETVDEAVQMFGEEALLTNALRNWTVTLQGNIRSGLRRGEAPEAIAQRLASAKMGVAQTGGKIDAEAAFKAKFLAASPEDRKKMIAELKDLAK